MGEYLVKKGDNLSTIAKNNGVSMKELLALNPNITNPNRIQINQKLNLKSQPRKRLSEIEAEKANRKNYNEWARRSPQSVWENNPTSNFARQHFDKDTWDTVINNWLGDYKAKYGTVNQFGQGERVKHSKEFQRIYDMVPEKYRGRLFNSLYSKDADILTKAATASIGGAAALTAGLPVAGKMLASAVANPISTIASAAGSYAGGKATDGIVSATTDHNNWADWASEKTGLPQSLSTLTNPGTWIGGGVYSLYNAGRNAGIKSANNTISRYNNVMGERRAAEQLAANKFNAKPPTPPGKGSTFLNKVNGNNKTVDSNYGVKGAKGAYHNPETGVHTRTSYTQTVNKSPQSSYLTSRGRHLNNQAGQRTNMVEQWADTPEVYKPWALTDTRTAGAAFIPQAPERHSSVSVGTPTPVGFEPNEEDYRYEQIKPHWGSNDFKKWYAQQEAGTTQIYKGKPYIINPGNGSSRREVGDRNGYIIPDSTSTSPKPGGYYIKQLQGGVPDNAQRSKQKLELYK